MPENEISDLIRRAKNRDEAARQELFTRLCDRSEFGAAIFRFVRRRFPVGHPGRRSANSDDIVQSALRSGMRKLDQLRGDSEGELMAWMRWILIDKIKKHGGRATVSLPEGAELADDGPSVEDIAIGREVRQRLFDACAELPLAQRLAVQLRLEGKSTEECARVLGIRPNSVIKRESRALSRLRQVFAEDDGAGGAGAADASTPPRG